MPFSLENKATRISRDLILGCSIFLAALGGLIVSCLLVNTTIPPQIPRGMGASANQAPAKLESKPLSEIAARAAENHEMHSERPLPSGRFCVNLNGKIFGWDWPNVPFGAIAC